MSAEPSDVPPSRAGSARRWLGAGGALLVFSLALGTALHGFWGSDLRVEVPAPVASLQENGGLSALAASDYRLVVWGVARNAWTLLHRPFSLYDAEPCAPAENTLALSHPAIAPAIVAVPAQLLLGDPVATFNAALLLKVLIAALAMYLLVADWSGSRVAGIAAGLLYAFHAQQLARPFHLPLTDNAWLLFALFFARRLFAQGRWRDAIGLGVACALQTATSFYPFLAAVIAAVPMLAWLLWSYRFEHLRPGPALAALAIAVVAAVLVFAPYLANRGGAIGERAVAFYAAWSDFLPGGRQFPGWTCTALAVAAFALGRRRALGEASGDPRLALLVAALLVAFFAAGGNQEAQKLGAFRPTAVRLPNPFAALAAIVPGLESVRGPLRLAHGARELFCILAGLGAAAVLRALPARAMPWAAALLVALAFAETLRPAFLGMSQRPRFSAVRMRPGDPSLAFFERLAETGNTGPLLEVPITADVGYRLGAASVQHLRSAYHHRRTSGCLAAFIPPEVYALGKLSDGLPGDDAIDEALALGFTTLVVDARPPGDLAERIRSASKQPGSRLALVLESGPVAAYALRERSAYTRAR